MVKRYREIGGRLRELRHRLGYTSARSIAQAISRSNPYGHIMPEMTYLDQESGKMPHPEVIYFLMQQGGSAWWIFSGIGGCFAWGGSDSGDFEINETKLKISNLLDSLPPEEEVRFLQERLPFAQDRVGILFRRE